jgi:hypothetical protein
MDQSHISRRNLLKSGSVLAAASVVGFGGMFGTRAMAQGTPETAQDVINIAATAELFASTHYLRALDKGTKAKFAEGELSYLKAGLEQEYFHYTFLVSLGAKALTDKFYFPVGTFNDKKTFATVTGIAETVFVGAYLAAIHTFATLGMPENAAIAGQVLGTEAQHLLFMNQLAGVNPPNNLGIMAAPFYEVKDAVPVVSPLLDGKEGALGKMETDAVAAPTADAVLKAIGGKSLLLTKLAAPFGTAIAPFAKKK